MIKKFSRAYDRDVLLSCCQVRGRVESVFLMISRPVRNRMGRLCIGYKDYSLNEPLKTTLMFHNCLSLFNVRLFFSCPPSSLLLTQ